MDAGLAKRLSSCLVGILLTVSASNAFAWAGVTFATINAVEITDDPRGGDDACGEHRPMWS